ncbi:MAG: HlyD family efflux transporter periplasmic adaptor subunit [Candidatus Nealsonbacteria bacterium]|nr:HlyD family efflux transporter periplasmic adaptor subunit [Candidatus Nealsonbacteria bacterium]
MLKILKTILQHKIIMVIIIIALIGGGYVGYKKFSNNSVENSYVLATVEKGTLVTSISGAGQVSALNQLDIKPKVSGDVISVKVKNGQEVKMGTLIMQIDTVDTAKALRNAETDLETAKLELEELLSPPDELTLLQAENSLAQAKESKQKAEDSLKKNYEDAFNGVTNVFLELPSIMAGLNSVLFSNSFSVNQQNIDYYADAVKAYDQKVLQYKIDTYNKYQIAKNAYNQNFIDYKSASRFSDDTTIENLINTTYNASKDIAEAIKNANDLVQFYQAKLIEHNFKPETLSSTYLSNLNAYTGKTNSYLVSLLSIQRSFQDNKETVINAERTIREKELSLDKLKAGADELSIRAKKITVQQKEDALFTAKQNLADCSVRAPFDGVIATLNSKKGDPVTSGTVVATIITKQQLAEISLNEVDIAKVKIGQKVTLTFDAVSDLSITGEVVEINNIGTVSQGVVNYSVKIVFDTQDERIKPGMSVNTTIITDVKQNVLLVPNSAVKTTGNNSYVEILEGNTTSTATNARMISKTLPRQQQVEIGLSNDS